MVEVTAQGREVLHCVHAHLRVVTVGRQVSCLSSCCTSLLKFVFEPDLPGSTSILTLDCSVAQCWTKSQEGKCWRAERCASLSLPDLGVPGAGPACLHLAVEHQEMCAQLTEAEDQQPFGPASAQCLVSDLSKRAASHLLAASCPVKEWH